MILILITDFKGVGFLGLSFWETRGYWMLD